MAASLLDPSVAVRLRRDRDGLVPAVVQDATSRQVLMVGWMNDEALHRTLTTGRTTFWSRSRQAYWRKGDTSGHVQHVREVRLDCDGDTLLVLVDQSGAACHTGATSCFDEDLLTRLEPRNAGEDPALDLATFRRLARDRRVIPVTRRLLADGETPIGLYRKLAAGRPGTFLLESAEHGGAWSRWSFVGARSRATLTERNGAAHWVGEPPVGLPRDGDPLQAVRRTLEALHTERVPGLPPLTSGLVGLIAYDAVRRLERLPDGNPDELGVPEIALMLVTDLAVLDHTDGSVLLIANAVNHDNSDERVDEAYADALARLDRMEGELARPAPATVVTVGGAETPEFDRRTSEADYCEAVERAKAQIRDGEAFQVVVSQRFSRATSADPVDVYRALRATNPSPYMYLLRFDGFDVVGSSPEALVQVSAGRALMHPIAGTRPRGATPEEDLRLGEELLADEKERAEHLMLVDLGRNDLGRVCRPGSVEVVDFMSLERYSHVTHIVSTVVGEVAQGRTAFDVVTACFPAGTLSGAPKPRAMEIIDELEPVRRGLYGGIVGYLDFAGDADTAIAIRTALLQNGVAHVQAGAGVVADSDPAAEDREARAKAMAVLRAVALAESMRPVP